MGKGCVRFKSLEDLALDVVGRTVARVRGGAHGQLPDGEGAHGQGKEQRKEGRQEVRGEEGETRSRQTKTNENSTRMKSNACIVSAQLC